MPKFWVKLDAEFADREAAERFEQKLRKLLQHDNMLVIDTREGKQ